MTCPLNSYCSEHGFFHGAEASELREGIESITTEYGSDRAVVRDLLRLLDKVDARDSLADLERRKLDELEPIEE